jgi:TRAP-type transport system periplasmic protein
MKYYLRIFLITMTVLAVFISGNNSEANAATVIKIATLAPEGSGLYTTIKTATNQIERETAGEIKFKIYPGGVMGNDDVVLRKMRSGQIQGATFTAGGISSVYPNFHIMTMPFLIRSYAELNAVRAEIDRVLIDNLAKHKYYAMGIMGNGFVYMMSRKPVEKVSDLRGLKIWIPEGDLVSRMVFENAGVSSVPLQLPDVLTGLQTGLIDTVSNSPVGAIVMQWFTKVKYLTETPLMYSYGTFAFSERGWKKIPDKYKARVREIIAAQLKILDGSRRGNNAQALQALKNQGINFVRLGEREIPALQLVADKAIAQLVAEGMLDQELLEKIRLIVSTVRAAKQAN